MKITKHQLKRIIAEELMSERYGKDYLSRSHRGGRGEEADPKLDFTRYAREPDLFEDSGEEEGEHYRDDEDADDKELEYLRHHLDKLQHDKDYDEDHVSESRRRQVRRLRSLLEAEQNAAARAKPNTLRLKQRLDKIDEAVEVADSKLDALLRIIRKRR